MDTPNRTLAGGLGLATVLLVVLCTQLEQGSVASRATPSSGQVDGLPMGGGGKSADSDSSPGSQERAAGQLEWLRGIAALPPEECPPEAIDRMTVLLLRGAPQVAHAVDEVLAGSDELAARVVACGLGSEVDGDRIAMLRVVSGRAAVSARILEQVLLLLDSPGSNVEVESWIGLILVRAMRGGQGLATLHEIIPSLSGRALRWALLHMLLCAERGNEACVAGVARWLSWGTPDMQEILLEYCRSAATLHGEILVAVHRLAGTDGAVADRAREVLAALDR